MKGWIFCLTLLTTGADLFVWIKYDGMQKN